MNAEATRRGTKAKRAGAVMNEALRRRLDAITAILAEGEDTVEARHRVGDIIARVTKDPERYGASAVPLLASALGRDETSLYRYAHVAVRWSASEMARLVTRAKRSGVRLTWSHLVSLSAIPKRSEREALLERVFVDRLSVREIDRDVRRTTVTAKWRTPIRSVRRATADAEKIIGSVATLANDYDALSARMARTTDATPFEEVVLWLHRARAVHEQLAEANGRVLQSIDTLLKRVIREIP